VIKRASSAKTFCIQYGIPRWIFEGQTEHKLHHVDDEFNQFAIEQTSRWTCSYLSITYELMASYWPAPDATTNDPIIADLMNRLPKIVVFQNAAKG